MNYKMIFHTTGYIIRTEAALLLIPFIVSLIYKEKLTAAAFLATAAGAFLLSVFITFFTKTKNKVIYSKEGFAIVALAWIAMSAIGAFPFVITGEIPHYYNAFFETVSGFTTTGASILTDVTALSHGSLLWRSFTHWIGGMGFIVFVIAIFPNISDRSIHIMRAEVPGPAMDKFVPRTKDTAKILYLIYIVLTAIEIIFLYIGEMNFFESVCYAFGTAGTGGFSLMPDGVASYSPYTQWIITIFMLVFGINFNIYYLILIKRAKNAFKSGELRAYIAIVVAATAAIAFNIRGMYNGFSETLRHAAFQVSSIITTTGFATTDFSLWPDFSKAIILILMICGGCAGSTAGGIKVSRIVILFKTIKREFKQLLHPRAISTVHYEGKPLDSKTVSGVGVYLAIYCACLAFIFLVLSIEPFGPETNLSAAFATFNNVGPALGAAGPMANYNIYSPFSKLVMSFAMLLGRLEIFPLLIAITPHTWSKKR